MSSLGGGAVASEARTDSAVNSGFTLGALSFVRECACTPCMPKRYTKEKDLRYIYDPVYNVTVNT